MHYIEFYKYLINVELWIYACRLLSIYAPLEYVNICEIGHTFWIFPCIWIVFEWVSIFDKSKISLVWVQSAIFLLECRWLFSWQACMTNCMMYDVWVQKFLSPFYFIWNKSWKKTISFMIWNYLDLLRSCVPTIPLIFELWWRPVNP